MNHSTRPASAVSPFPSSLSSSPSPPPSTAPSAPADASSSLDALVHALGPLLVARDRERERLGAVIRLIDVLKSSSGHDMLAALSRDRLVALMRVMRLAMTIDKDPALRANTLRALRYIFTTPPSLSDGVSTCALLALGVFYALNMDLLVIRSLERESKYLWERLQAFKLFKQIFTLQPHTLSRSLILSILSIVETQKDDFRRVSLEALREMMMSIPDLVCACNGMRVLIDAILDPANQEISASLTLTLLFLLDQESTRRLLRPSIDLIRLFAVFTDHTAQDGSDREARRLAAHRSLVTMMRSWPGIICLCSDPAALRSLIQMLVLPSTVKGSSWAREAVFDLILEVMQVVKSVQLRAQYTRQRKSVRLSFGNVTNLLHPYITAVLLAFLECGLVETLTHLASNAEPEFRSVSTKLLIEILALSAHLLPNSLTASLNSLGPVVEQASSFGGVDVSRRVRALQLITTLSSDSVTASKLKSFWYEKDKDRELDFAKEEWQPPPWAQDSPLLPSHDTGSAHDLYSSSNTLTSRMVQHGIRLDRYILVTTFNHLLSANPSPSSSISHRTLSASAMRYTHEQSIDMPELEAMIKRTQVTFTKDYRLWDPSLILQLLEGPLQSLTHLTSIMSKTKFIKRLCSFLKPEKQLFSSLDFIPPHVIFVQIAVSLFKVLLASPEGREYMYFHQLCECIMELILSEISKSTFNNKANTSFSSSSHSNNGIASTNSSSISLSFSNLSRRSTSLDGEDPASPTQQHPVNSFSSTGSNSTPSSNSNSFSGALGLTEALNAAKSIGAQAQAHTRKLTQMVKGKNSRSTYRCLSRTNAPRKLSQSYFLFIGILSSSKFGLAYFDRFGLYDHLYRVCEDHSKDYLTRMLIINFDYNERSARTLLETWVKNGSLSLRKFAISFLRGMMRLKGHGECAWAISMITSQLQHPDFSLRASVLSLLEEAVQDPTCMNALIKKKPQLAGCGALASPLQLSMLSCSAGLQFVQSTTSLSAWMSVWKDEGCQQYVESLESSLVTALNDPQDAESKVDNSNHATGGAGNRADTHRGDEILKGASLHMDKSSNVSIQHSAFQQEFTAKQPTSSQHSTGNLTPALSSTAFESGTRTDSPSAKPTMPFLFTAPPADNPRDNYFLARLHDLPFRVELFSELPGGRIVLIPSDLYIFSSPYEVLERRTVSISSSSSPTPSTDPSNLHHHEDELHPSPHSTSSPLAHGFPLQVFLCCMPLDAQGRSLLYPVDPACNLRARVSIGGGVNTFSPGSGNLTPSSLRSSSAPFRYSGSTRTAYPSSPQTTSSQEPLNLSKNGSIRWQSSYFTQPMSEQVCRSTARTLQNVDFTPTVAQVFAGPLSSSSLSTSSSNLRFGSLWTTSKDEDKALWKFVINSSGAPSSDSPSSQAGYAKQHGQHSIHEIPLPSSNSCDFALESVAFPIELPSAETQSVYLAKHLYGQLARTQEGCHLLKQSGHLEEFTRAVRQGEQEWYESLHNKSVEIMSPLPLSLVIDKGEQLNTSAVDCLSPRLKSANRASSVQNSASSSPFGSPRPHFSPMVDVNPLGSMSASSTNTGFTSAGPSFSSAASLNKKAALWTLGHIASSASGFALLNQYQDIIGFISDAALHHPTLSFRGTCFYILSLMSHSSIGRRALFDLGWDCPTDTSFGVIIPRQHARFLAVQSTEYVGSWPLDRRRNVFGVPPKQPLSSHAPIRPPLLRPYSEAELDILLHMANLCNYVTQRAALTALRQMKANPAFANLFTSPQLLLDTFRLMATNTFKMPARRFLMYDLLAGVVFNEGSLSAFDAPFLTAYIPRRTSSSDLRHSLGSSSLFAPFTPRMNSSMGSAKKTERAMSRSSISSTRRERALSVPARDVQLLGETNT